MQDRQQSINQKLQIKLLAMRYAIVYGDFTFADFALIILNIKHNYFESFKRKVDQQHIEKLPTTKI